MGQLSFMSLNKKSTHWKKQENDTFMCSTVHRLFFYLHSAVWRLWLKLRHMVIEVSISHIGIAIAQLQPHFIQTAIHIRDRAAKTFSHVRCREALIKQRLHLTVCHVHPGTSTPWARRQSEQEFTSSVKHKMLFSQIFCPNINTLTVTQMAFCIRQWNVKSYNYYTFTFHVQQQQDIKMSHYNNSIVIEKMWNISILHKFTIVVWNVKWYINTIILQLYSG